MNSEKSSVAVTGEFAKNGRTVVRKAKKFSESVNSPSRRKSLQLLQPVAGNQTKLVGTDGFVRLTNQTNRTPKRKHQCDGKTQPKKVFRPDSAKNFTIFEDRSKSSTSQQVLDKDAVAMMTQEEPTERYWEELAETRRAALEETLKENEELHMENVQLKEENERLKVMADQAEYLADVVETLMGKQGSSSSDEESDDAENTDEDAAPSIDPNEEEKENKTESECDDEEDPGKVFESRSARDEDADENV